MAKRPSVKEILEAARKAGPAKPESSEPTAAPAEEAALPATEPPPVKASEETVAPASTPPKPANLGRPLTLKEKLAAARAGGPPAPSTAAPPKPPSAESPSLESEPAAAAESPPPEVPQPAAPLGRPLTLKEKLAAARSGGTASTAPVTAPKPAAGTTPSAAAGAAKATTAAPRALPPLDKITDPRDLAEALRQSGAKKAQEVAAKTKELEGEPSRKPAREKEAKPQSVLPRPLRFLRTERSRDPELSRRGFFIGNLFISWVVLGWAAFTAGCLQFTVMLARFMFPNVLAEPPSTIKVGLPSNFEPEEVNERFKAEWGFWIVRSTRYNGQDIVYALKSICTHLGCPPNWLSSEQKFKCPCHGSGFYISGINFEGPAPRPLERYKVFLADDGQMVVDKSQWFQQELGQWSDPDSFISA